MSPHKVPTHLDQPDGIGKFSMRQLFLGGGALAYIGPNVWANTPPLGPALGDLIRTHYPGLVMFGHGSLPLLPIATTVAATAPLFTLALPFRPPPEHGLFAGASFLRHRGTKQPDAVTAGLGSITVDGDRIETDFGIGAAWELPSINLRLADAQTVETAQQLWGEALNGLTCPIQTLTVSNRIDPERLVGAIDQYRPTRSPALPHGAGILPIQQRTPEQNARRLAKWLREDVVTRHLIERRHFLVVMSADEHEYVDNVQEIEDALGTLGFRADLITRLNGDDLRRVIQRTWSTRPLPAGRGELGPQEKWDIHHDAVYSDGEWHIMLAWGKWPRIMRDNALATFTDGPYDADVIQHIRPIEAEDILDGLERRLDAMRSSRPDRKRSLAIEDLETFVQKLEAGEESPFEVAMYLHVHGPDLTTVKQDAKRIEKRVRRSGGRSQTLLWEHAKAMLAVAPLATNSLDKRTRRVDTSSIQRLYPWSASAMWMEGAVPWGETIDSKRPVGWTPWRRPLIPNPHLVVYMISGGGKGFSWKVWSSRALFAGMTHEFFGFDQAEEDLALGEYGRWAAYCGIEYRHIKTVADIPAALADLDNYHWRGPGICWNIAQLPTTDRPQVMAETKAALFKRAAEHPARRQWFVDELWSFAKAAADLGTDPHWIAASNSAIEDGVRRGRHLEMGMAFFTQRAKDSLELSPLMQIIQSQCSSQMFGMQSPSEITDVAGRLHWTPSEIEAIKKFTPGQALIAAGPWRVAMRVTASDDEYDMANTDGKPSIEAVRPSSADDVAESDAAEASA